RCSAKPLRCSASTPAVPSSQPLPLENLSALQQVSLLSESNFGLIAAAYVPGNRIKAVLGHPMVVGVQIWALAHLLANGTLAAVVLFGAFLVWSVVDFASARRRDRQAGTRYPAGTLARDAAVVVIGLASWILFAFVLHGWLAGVPAYL
ncbi:NnrU family protein, partial [Cupriavidus sp. CV2]|uniref:NnrU family protein n=1 Tax=Cupriavidus ulmosensis TaxID=3065913 RepID=UPI00296B2DD1